MVCFVLSAVVFVMAIVICWLVGYAVARKREIKRTEDFRDTCKRETDRVYQLLAVSNARYDELKSLLSEIGSRK